MPYLVGDLPSTRIAQEHENGPPVVDAHDLFVVVDKRFDGVDESLGHLVHLVEDEHRLRAGSHVATDPVDQLKLRGNGISCNKNEMINVCEIGLPTQFCVIFHFRHKHCKVCE